MGDTSSGPGGVLYNTPSGASGLFKSLDPAYQAQQQQVQQNQIGLDAARAFPNGAPIDPTTGQPDFNGMANTFYQKGDIANAEKMQQLGLQYAGINASLAGANVLANGPGGSPPASAGQPQGGGGQGAAPGSSPTPAPMEVFAHSIGAQESSNRYDALGPKQKNGDQGIGYYQVMASNVGPWTQEVLGQAMSPQDFLANPQAQDAVFRAKFGQAIQQYGSPADAASVWFSGRPLKQAGNTSDSLGTTAPTYVQKFLAGLGPASQALRSGQGQPSAAPPGAPPASAAGATSMPAGGQPQPISFGSGDASSAPGSSPPPGGTAPPSAASGSGAGPDVTTYPVVTDAMMSSAQANIQAGKGGPQDYNRVRAYAVQHNIPLPPGHAQMEPEDGASDGTPSATAAMPGQHPYGPPPQPQGATPAPQMSGGALPPPNAVSAPQQAGAPRLPVVQGGAGGPTPPPPQPQPQPPTAALQPAQPNASATGRPVVLDPSYGGMVPPQWQSNPGAYASNLRAQAMRVKAYGGDNTALLRQAEDVANSIARSDITTPGMREYGLAVGQGYNRSFQQFQVDQAAQKAQAEQGARLQADTDPSRIAFAGQQAQAQAAGTALGQNSAAAIGARAQNAAQVAEATQNGTALGKLPEQYAQAATAATKQNAIVSDMQDQAGQFNMGANADREQALNATMSDLGHRMGVDTSSIDGKVAAYQQYVKLGGNLVRQAIKDTGGRAGGIQEMQFVSNTLPSPATSPDGFKGVAAFLQGSNDYEIAKQSAADAYQKQNGTLSGFESSFTQNVTPTATILHRLQQDQPQMFQQTVQRLKASPAGQAVLQKAAGGLSYLAANGGGG